MTYRLVGAAGGTAEYAGRRHPDRIWTTLDS
jgi:hypothetical protein